MIQKTFSIVTTETTKARIWALMANVNDWSKWDKGVEFAELQSEFKTGGHFLLKPKGGPKVTIKLAEVLPGNYFKDQTTFPLAKMYGEHWYEETSLGLKITITMTIMGPLSFLWNKLVMKDIVAGLEADAKAQIEASKNL